MGTFWRCVFICSFIVLFAVLGRFYLRFKSISSLNNNNTIKDSFNNNIINNNQNLKQTINTNLIHQNILKNEIIKNDKIKNDKIININTNTINKKNMDTKESDYLQLSPIENALKEASIKGVKFRYNDVTQSYELVNKLIPNDDKNDNEIKKDNNKLIKQYNINNIITKPINTLPNTTKLPKKSLETTEKSKKTIEIIKQIKPQLNVQTLISKEVEKELPSSKLLYKEPSFKELHVNDYIKRDQVYKNVLIKHILKYVTSADDIIYLLQKNGMLQLYGLDYLSYSIYSLI